jgi:dTDP-4-dehydrorhamnose reductase
LKEKILIISGKSQLGMHLKRHLSKNKFIFKTISRNKKFDYSKDYRKLGKIIKKFNPNLCVNLAAMTNYFDCERLIKKAYEINTFFPYKLAALCKLNKCYLIHFSSDAIFSGKNNQKLINYKTIPNPTTIYGKTKFLGENLLKNFENALIIRLPMLFGEYCKNTFTYKMLRLVAKNKKIYVSSNSYCGPIYADDVCNFITKNIFTNIDWFLKKKIIQLTYNNRMSRYKFIKMLANKISKKLYVKKTIFKKLKLKTYHQKGLMLCNVKNFKKSSYNEFIKVFKKNYNLNEKIRD